MPLRLGSGLGSSCFIFPISNLLVIFAAVWFLGTPAQSSEAQQPSSAGFNTKIGHYNIYLGGIQLAEIEMRISHPTSHPAPDPALSPTEKPITIDMSIAARGLVDMVTDFTAQAHFTGFLGNKIILAQKIETSWQEKETLQKAVLTFDDRFAPKTFTTSDPDARTRKAVTPLPPFSDITEQTVSPLLAMFRPNSAKPCEDTLTLFDGQRLSSLIPLAAPIDAEGANPNTFTCQFKWIPRAGHTERTINFAQNMMPLDVTFTHAAGLYVPQKLLIETRYGYVAMKLNNDFGPPPPEAPEAPEAPENPN